MAFDNNPLVTSDRQIPKDTASPRAILWAGVSPARSALMARIRSRDTKPEMLVRRELHARGFRFRLHRRDLPGTPDIVLPRYRIAVLVHGCFWHQHDNCRMASRPRTRRSYWDQKLAANVKRDREAVAALTVRGWRVEIIWECELKRPDLLARRIDRLVQALTPVSGGGLVCDLRDTDNRGNHCPRKCALLAREVAA